MQKITPCLWFDNQAASAARFYTSIFKKSKVGMVTHYDENSAAVSGQPKGSVLTVAFKIEGQEFLALNGGPIFKFTPAISFFIYCKTAKEVDTFYKKLVQGGKVMMALDKYPFSERYAFIADKYGVSWQIILADSKQKIVPCLLFVKEKEKKAEAAIKFYVKTFKKSKINLLDKYGPSQGGTPGTVRHARFMLEGQQFTAMSGAGDHRFTFTEAISFIVNCKTQKEIDYYWKKLSAVKESEQCGWLKDKYGVSWQIVPIQMDAMMKNPKKSKHMMKAMLEMHKLDLKKLQEAYNS